MRFSVQSALCGVMAVSAAAMPANSVVEDARIFGRQSAPLSFKPVPHSEAVSKVEAANNATDGKPLVFGTLAATGTPCSNVRIRTEWRQLSSAQKSSFVNAVKCLINKPSAGSYPGSRNRYEDLVWVHQQMVGTIHMVGQFLPWHRYYLHVFEDILKTECGYSQPIPWWDETKDAGHFASSPVFDSAYFGIAATRQSNGQASCMLHTGVFAGTTCHIGPGSSFTTRCLSRGLDESLTAQCNANYVATCRSASRYRDFEPCVEYGPHAYGHNGIGSGGGIMSDVASSPGDPIFFMHHGFVDHQWRIWQNDANPSRLNDIASPTNSNGGGTLTLDYTLSSRGLRPDVKVRDVMDTTATYLCYKYNY